MTPAVEIGHPLLSTGMAELGIKEADFSEWMYACQFERSESRCKRRHAEI
jgi:hypothetical protein